MTLLEYSPEVADMWYDTGDASAHPGIVTPGSHKELWWQCSRGHIWQAAVHSVALGGCRCPYCAGKRAISGKTDLATTNPEIAAQWDPKKNGELTPEKIMPSSHEKIWWRCELGHSWQAAPFSRTKKGGAGCPYCTGKRVLAGFNDLAFKRPGIAEEWYQPLNGELKPSDVTPGSNKKVWWQCREGHVWQAAVYSRTRRKGSGCPVCTGVVKARRKRTVTEKQPVSQRKRNRRQETPAGADLRQNG